MFRATVARNARLFSTSVRSQKSVTETVKDAASKANRVISDAALKGIEKGGTSTPKPCFIEMTTDLVHTDEAASAVKGDASKASGQASGKASELAGEAKGKANELAGQAKGKVEETKKKM